MKRTEYDYLIERIDVILSDTKIKDPTKIYKQLIEFLKPEPLHSTFAAAYFEGISACELLRRMYPRSKARPDTPEQPAPLDELA